MKKIISLILTVLMIAAVVPFSAFAGRFEDIADGKWYTEGISFCAANGYMDGVAEGKFDRSSNLTRAMFVTILAKIDGVNTDAYANRTIFSDVAIGKWYTGAITWAAENNLASGIGEGLFGYKNNVTREQMALFLYVYTGYKALDTSASASVASYEDSGRIHGWALDAVKWAVASGLISGTSETVLDPRGTCTRAQAAVMIHSYVLSFLSDCEHDWVAPTCTEIGYCTKCTLKSGTELGHYKGTDDCTVTASCVRCGVSVNGVAHKATAATCTAASVCSVCGVQVAPAKGHSLSPATCTTPAKCKVCGVKQGSELGHTTSNGICTRCGNEVFASYHNKLVYYLNTKGEDLGNGDKGFTCYIETDTEIYTTFISITPGLSTVYITTMLENIEGVYYLETALTDRTYGAFKITTGGYFDETHYYSGEGHVSVSTGYAEIYATDSSYVYTHSAYTKLMDPNAEMLFKYSAFMGDYLTKTYANGLSLKEYRFKSDLLYNM